MHHKTESALGRTCLLAALAYFNSMSTAAYAEMNIALMSAFKTVVLSHIKDTQVFVNHVALSLCIFPFPVGSVFARVGHYKPTVITDKIATLQ